ncbi:MAG TPA: CbiX/SirB N-terminal domain-containing protein [Opitutus sp.]|nr:CbiX/SirB N-terminal domain-containing protein [Opitutus sp.]
MKRVLLVDNGSLEPASTLQLRRIATELSAELGLPVDPVSIAHSNKVPESQLGGRAAELFEAGLDRVIAGGAREIVVAPLFVGPSYAIVRHLPAVVAERTKARTGFQARIAEPLFVAGETRLGRILADEVSALLEQHRAAAVGSAGRPRVAVVDHGSPSRAVTDVRDRVAAQVRELLGGAVADVAACSMERRPGEEFAFNEPLLENLLAREEWQKGPLAIALLFIAPGKHAGPDGDVAQIVVRARAGAMENVSFTPVMGTHPLLVSILADRVAAAVARF